MYKCFICCCFFYYSDAPVVTVKQSTRCQLHLWLACKIPLKGSATSFSYFHSIKVSSYAGVDLWMFFFYSLRVLISPYQCVLQSGEASFNCPEIAQVQPSLTPPYCYKRLLAWKSPQLLQAQTHTDTHRQTYCKSTPKWKNPTESVNERSNTERWNEQELFL